MKRKPSHSTITFPAPDADWGVPIAMSGVGALPVAYASADLSRFLSQREWTEAPTKVQGMYPTRLYHQGCYDAADHQRNELLKEVRKLKRRSART